MRCHFNDKDEETNSVSTALSIWSSTNIHSPVIAKSVNNFNGHDADSYSEELSNLCSLDSVSSPHKRKMLECDKEDFEERFRKIQRKRQLQRASAKAHLIIDDEDEDDDEFEEEERLCEQMEWIERENGAVNLNSWDYGEEDNLSFECIRENVPLMHMPRLKWREERRRLLKISMAKIRGVEDPEAYLRRSVLINNTVKRLQKDGAVNYKCHSVSTSSIFQGSTTYQNDNVNHWEFDNSSSDVVCKQHLHTDSAVGYDYAASVTSNNSTSEFSYPDMLTDVPYNALNFHLSFATFSTEKSLDAFQNEIVQNSPAFFSKNVGDEQVVNDASVSSRTLKSSSTHVFSSQPCGLQYRNPMHNEDSNSEYHESASSSSILDSVVYHSLIASLES